MNPAGPLRKIKNMVAEPLKSSLRPKVADWFHRIYYARRIEEGTWFNTFWRGVRVQKCPFDLWVYNELLFEIQPDLLIETGTFNGGSTLYFANMMDLIGKGRIISIDPYPQENLPAHPRIEYIKDSSTSDAVVERLRSEVAGASTVFVILDSDHSEKHVLDELRLYWPFVTAGSYMVVEDTNVNGHPVFLEHGPGPTEALQTFLRENDKFEVDRTREKHLMSFNVGGWLKRKA